MNGHNPPVSRGNSVYPCGPQRQGRARLAARELKAFKPTPAAAPLMSDATKIVLGTIGASAFLALVAIVYVTFVGI